MTTSEMPNPPSPLCDYEVPEALLEGRNILVTGAADGLGRAVALRCARAGANLLLLDRKQRKLETLYDQIVEQDCAEPILIPQDLQDADPQTCAGLARGIEHDAGILHGVVHIAGVLPGFRPMHRQNLEDWTRVMQVNLMACYLLTCACLPLLREADAASVVFTTAAAGRRGRAYWGSYALAYAAVERLNEIWADELAHNTSIRFNTLDPGDVATDMRSRNYPGLQLDTAAAPDAIAPAYLFLLGRDSNALSGGAWSAQTTTEEFAARPGNHAREIKI